MLKISSRLIGDVTILLDLDGRLALEGACRSLRNEVRRLLDKQQKKILLNAENVTVLDSPGSGALIDVYRDALAQGGALKLLKPRGEFKGTFQITRLFTIFDVYDDEEDALTSFNDSFHCLCPICGERSGSSSLRTMVLWRRQTCKSPACGAQFEVAPSDRSEQEVLVVKVFIQTYEKEYFEIVSGKPCIGTIMGRLDLFSSSAIQRAWGPFPYPGE